MSTFFNGSVELANGVIGGYAMGQAAIGFEAGGFSGLGGTYRTMLAIGYRLGGVSQDLINLTDSGRFDGGDSSIIDTGSLALQAGSLRVSASNSQGAELKLPVERVLASGGVLELSPLQSTLAGSSGTERVTLKGAVIAPEGEVDEQGYLTDFALAVGGAIQSSTVRLLVDQRSLLTGAERYEAMNLADYWQQQPLEASNNVLVGSRLKVKPGQAVQLQLQVDVSGSTLPQLRLGALVDGAFSNFAADALLDRMPSAAEQRQEAGSTQMLGLTAVKGLTSAQATTANPYVAAFVVGANGNSYRSFDFILEPVAGAVSRGRAIAGVGGAIERVEMLMAAPSSLYRSVDLAQWRDAALEGQLRARTAAGRDAVLELVVAGSGELQGAEVAKDAAGSGYLNGGSGVFQQRLEAGAGNSLLVEIVVEQGVAARARVLSASGAFSNGARIPLANTVTGVGSGLALTPVTRSQLDLNQVDETEIGIGSGQRYTGGWGSQAVLSYTQGGLTPATAINSGFNLSLPIITAAFGTPNAGWNTLAAFKDPQDAYTPGVDGYNFDSITNTSYLGKSVNGKTQVMAFAHADLRAIRSDDDLYLLDTALQRSTVYYSLYDGTVRDGRVVGWRPAEAIGTLFAGANRGLILEPFYAKAVDGASVGIEPVPGANDQLLAAWVNTSPSDETSIIVTIGRQEGDAIGSSRVNWSEPYQIKLGQLDAESITDLSLTYLDERTPVLSWSLATLMPYQAAVLKDNPLNYYRLDDLLDTDLIASVGGSLGDPGGLIRTRDLADYSSPFAEKLNDKAPVSTEFLGALWDGQSTDKPGDRNVAAYFGGGEFMLFNNPVVSTLMDPNSEAPFGYAYELWMRADQADGFASILDNGFYQRDAVLPGAGALKLPIYAERVATVDDEGNLGWLVNVWLDDSASASLPDVGIGSGLSPFNLSFAALEQSYNFLFTSSGGGAAVQQELELPTYAFGDLVKYSTKDGVLTSLQANGEPVLLHSTFVKDAASPGDEKTTEKSAELDLSVSVQQVKGWSLRKQLVDGVEKLIYTYGEDQAGVSTIEGALKGGDWNHVYVSYSTDRTTGQKLAELWINGELAGAVDDTAVVGADGAVLQAPTGFALNVIPIAVGYGYEGLLDELVVHSEPLGDPGDELRARLLSRYVNPKSASEATFYSQASPRAGTQQGDTNRLSDWVWGAPQTFSYSSYIPATTPGYYREGAVDLAAAGNLKELRGDGKEDLRLSMRLSELPYGAEITGIHVRTSDGALYGVGEGLSRGVDGKSLAAGTTLSGLVGVVAEGRLLNTKGSGDALSLSVMTQELNLDLYLPASTSLVGREQQVQVFYKNPDDLLQGTQSRLWGVSSTGALRQGRPIALPSRSGGAEEPNGMLLPSNPAALVVGGQTVPHQAVATSLKEINTGFGVTLATAADSYSLDPATGKESNTSFAERLAIASFQDAGQTLQLAAIASSTFDQPDSGNRGVIWVVDASLGGANARAAAAALSVLASLAADAPAALDQAKLKGVEILGKPGQNLANQLVWADLDRDGKPELVIGNPDAHDGAGEVVIIRGGHLLSKAQLTGAARRIDLTSSTYSINGADVLVLKGSPGAGFGSAVSAANFVVADAKSVDLAIGAPRESGTILVDRSGQSLATPLENQSVGAVYLLRGSGSLFSAPSQPVRVADGSLPQLNNYNYRGVEADKPRQFGAALAAAAGSGKATDLDGDGIADLVIGIPGLQTDLV
ncbi:hypothetical protein KBY71_14625, partial [Cyanobium sp. T1B-Tous]